MSTVADFEIVSRVKSFEGEVVVCRHPSQATGTPMRFSVFLPAEAKKGPVPVWFWLSGLTCTDENFTTKSGIQHWAAREGIAVVAPDTSPRGANIAGEADHWDFGVGAGYYVDATQSPWSKNYRMYSYVQNELPALVASKFPLDLSRAGISGHSMGGHGALVAALREPEKYRSVSAFAPITSATRSPWGQKAFSKLLGDDKEAWKQYDASLLVGGNLSMRLPILVDQGLGDTFLDMQLKPELLEEACRNADHPLELRRREGYDHSYYFIASFLEDHVKHFTRAL